MRAWTYTSYLGRELMMDCDVFLLLKFFSNALVIVQFGLSLTFHISLALMLLYPLKYDHELSTGIATLFGRP